MRKIVIAFLFILALVISLFATDDTKKEKQAVIKTVEKAYVKGIHTNRDTEAVREGFHENFIMFVNREGKVSHFSRDEWITRIEEGKKKNPDRPTPVVKAEYPMVEISGSAAAIRIELYRDGEHAYTDFMSLYKFGDDWKIVGKIYQSHR